MTVIGKYSRASTNLNELENLGCTIVHEVDVHTMNKHPLLQRKYFDRIVFNFPHAGFVYREHDSCQIEYVYRKNLLIFFGKHTMFIYIHVLMYLYLT